MKPLSTRILVALVALVICGVTSTVAGCCTAALEARTLQRRSQQQNETRFLLAARRLVEQRGATPVTLQRTRSWRQVPFGVPTPERTRTGEDRILIAAHLGLHPGLLVARQPDNRYLVIIAEPRTTHHRAIRSCACRSHGGAYRRAPRPPVFILPVKDLSRVTVIPARYHRRTVSVRQDRCPGPPVP